MNRLRRALLPVLGVALVAAVGIHWGVDRTPELKAEVEHALSAPSLSAVLSDVKTDVLSARATVTLEDSFINGNGTTRSVVVGNGASIPLSFGYLVRYFQSIPTPHLTLQRKLPSGTWVDTAATVTHDAGTEVTAWTPAFSTSAVTETVQYRLQSSTFSDLTGGVANTSVSPVFQVRYENQSRYTGLAAFVYRTVRPYCPTTAVHLTTLDLGEAGQYTTGGLLILVDSAVGRTEDVRAIDKRALALHECSHERQWVAYGSTLAGRAVMSAAATRYFHTDVKPAGVTTPYPYEAPIPQITPIEHAADCGAQSVNPGGYLGYGGYCSPSELRAARKLLLGSTY